MHLTELEEALAASFKGTKQGEEHEEYLIETDGHWATGTEKDPRFPFSRLFQSP